MHATVYKWIELTRVERAICRLIKIHNFCVFSLCACLPKCAVETVDLRLG